MMAINAQMSSDCFVCDIVSHKLIWLYKVMKDEYIYEFKQAWKTRKMKVYSDASNFQLTGTTVI